MLQFRSEKIDVTSNKPSVKTIDLLSSDGKYHLAQRNPVESINVYYSISEDPTSVLSTTIDVDDNDILLPSINSRVLYIDRVLIQINPVISLTMRF